MTNQITRAIILSGFLLASTGYLACATTGGPAPTRTPLADLPLRLARWQGRGEDLDKQALAVLGVDDYVNRVYRRDDGSVGLYIGYHKSQRPGERMPSPWNCLPGSGCRAISSGRLAIPVPAPSGAGSAHSRSTPVIEVNRCVVQNAGQTMLVLYWYQSHGRVVPSEFWEKIYTVLDAIHLNRTDAALVRVVVPVPDANDGAEKRAEQMGTDFVQTLFPLLSQHLAS
jgi:EpsI family protein